MLIFLRYAVGLLNAFGLIGIFFYPFTNVIASATSRLEAVAATVPSILIFSVFALMAAYAFNKKFRISKIYWTLGFFLNSICLIFLFIAAAKFAIEMARLLIPVVVVITLNLLLILNNTKNVTDKAIE